MIGDIMEINDPATRSPGNAYEQYLTEEQVASLFPLRPSDCHKGSFGYVALIGGSLEYSGAIRLAAYANAAMRSGAGVATVAAPRSICPLIAPQIMEATLYPLSDSDGRIVFNEEELAGLCRRYDCIAFGMGIGNSAESVKAVEYLLTHYDRKLIIDADGLNAMSELDHAIIRSSRAQLVLTPHLKEFSRLSGMSIAEAKADPAAAALWLAGELNSVVLLKGSTTVVAGKQMNAGPEHSECCYDHQGESRPALQDHAEDITRRISPASTGGACSWLNKADAAETAGCRILMTDRGCAGMATAGSGDVLSGILSAVCVNADDLVLAAAAGAYINGAAGELAQSRHSDVTMTAGDTAVCVAEVIESILAER